MSDKLTSDSNSRQLSNSRPAPMRPPITWPVRNTVPNNHSDRASAIARQNLERVYDHEGEPNQVERQNLTEDETTQPTEHHVMREQPFDPQRYHNAWQQYYQQYFYRYYASWWQQQQTQLENKKIEENNYPSEHQKLTNEIRHKIRTTVKTRAEKVKSSSHFKPLLAAFSTGAAILLINYNQVLVGAVKQYIAPGSVVLTPVIVEPNTSTQVGSEPKIIIPKIGVEVPVVYDEPKVDEASYQKALERGVVRLGTTSNPGTNGNVVIGGHSSNNVFNAGKYKYVFVNLKRLDVGDIFYLNYNSRRYTYKITVAKKIISPKDVSVLSQTTTPTVTLFTCDPPGTNINRLIVQAEQIDPDPSKATKNNNPSTKINKDNPLPSVAPSIWDRLFN